MCNKFNLYYKTKKFLKFSTIQFQFRYPGCYQEFFSYMLALICCVMCCENISLNWFNTKDELNFFTDAVDRMHGASETHGSRQVGRW